MQAPAPATLRLSDDELAQTARLLIRLRWVAGLSILLLTAVARWGLGVDLPAGRCWRSASWCWAITPR